MTARCLEIIRREHDALAALLRSITLLLQQRGGALEPADFAALRAMVFYIDEFPEKRHHRKESELLFPKLRARTPLHRDLLDHLDQDHGRGEARIRELERALLAYEVVGEPRRAGFETAARQYVDFYLGHMAMEEREVLPLAEKVLTADDWADLDAAFAANRDGLAGAEPEADYARLFTHIVNLVPAPIGLGPAPGRRPGR